MKSKKLFFSISLFILIIFLLISFWFLNLIKIVDSKIQPNLTSSEVSNNGISIETKNYLYLIKKVYIENGISFNNRITVRVFNSIPDTNSNTIFGRTKFNPDGNYIFAYKITEVENSSMLDVYINGQEFIDMSPNERNKNLSLAIITSLVESKIRHDNNFEQRQIDLREKLITELEKMEELPIELYFI